MMPPMKAKHEKVETKIEQSVHCNAFSDIKNSSQWEWVVLYMIDKYILKNVICFYCME